jgi:hypothetical protein
MPVHIYAPDGKAEVGLDTPDYHVLFGTGSEPLPA